MAVMTELFINDAVGHIAKGVSAALEEKIKAALMEQAEKVVEEVTKKICRNLKENLSSYRSDIDGKIFVSLILDKVKHDF